MCLLTLAANGSPMLQRKESNPDQLSDLPHNFQNPKSCPQLLISEHPSLQHLLEGRVLDKNQLQTGRDDSEWQMAGIKASRDRRASWK